ncbi:MAG: ribbon-helix-helix domain-containing protein [Candidatus Nitrosopumilus sp. bin_7KS]
MAKEKFSVSMDESLVKWIDNGIKKKKFANRSHALEYAITALKEESYP